MRLIEIELINHVVIPRIFKLLIGDNDVISINGLNGSGKTFLINCLHPLSVNKRYSSMYSILSGEDGLKRLVYQMKGYQLEVIHEYKAKGEDKHTCKSYINRIEGKETTELNPTGHRDVFNDIVYEELSFNVDSFTTSFLSPNTEHIATAAPGVRRKILETTLNSPQLKVYQKNNRELLKESKTLLKVYGQQQVDLYSKTGLQSKDSMLTALEEKKDILNNYKSLSEVYLDKLKEINFKLIRINEEADNICMSDLEECITLIELTECEDMTVAEIINLYHSSKSVVDNAELIIEGLTTKRDKIVDALDAKDEYDSLYKDVKELRHEMGECSSKINRFVIDEPSVPNLSIISRTLDKVVEVISGINHSYSGDFKSIENEHIHIMKAYEIDAKFVSEYEEKMELCSEDLGVNDVVYNNTCLECNYYNTFALAEKFLYDNKDKYRDLEMNNRNKLRYINDYNMFISMKATIENMFELINSTLTGEIMRELKLNDISELLSNIESMQIDVVFSTKIEPIINEYNRYSNLAEDLRYKTVVIDNLKNVDNDINIEELNIIRQKLIKETKNIATKLEFLEKADGLIPVDTVYGSNNIKELEELRDKSLNVTKVVREMNALRKEYDLEVRNKSDAINELTKSINNLEHSIDTLESLGKFIVNTSENLVVYSKCRDILEKTIPIRLLKENISFIELTVNSILEENDISLSIEIVIDKEDGNTIYIKVLTKTRNVSDIKMVSSGEGAFLGITLNSVISHICGYGIISFDESDANLDVINKGKYCNLLTTILNILSIEQIICISHNVSGEIDAKHIVLGEEYDTTALQGEVVVFVN